MIDFLKSHIELPFSNPVLVFSLILLIILLSPILLKKLNIPGIIGLIISGLIVGPNALNLLEKNSAVELFSTIGLLYIMFIAGLELDMNTFKANKYKSMWFGFLTFTIPISIGFPVSYYGFGYDLLPSMLIGIMFATHTLVAYPIVSRLGIAKNEAVAITVGGTIITDTSVLISLAIIMGHSHGSISGLWGLKLAISILILSFLIFYVMPKVTKWFLQKLESEKHAQYIFILSLVFLSAFLAEVAGVEPIIGAFMAGLALNTLIPHSSALMNRIEFIGNALFIPFFLISVGMLVDVTVILSSTMVIIVAVTFTSVTVTGKMIAAWITQKTFGYSAIQRKLIFGLSSAQAAAILVVVMVGYNNHIIDVNVLNGTIILILFTVIIASVVTEQAAKALLIIEQKDLNIPEHGLDKTEEHILVPIAKLTKMEKMLDFATLIKCKKSGHPITLLSVVPNDQAAERNMKVARKRLEEFVSHGAATETPINTLATIDFNHASGIARASREILADIIILGWPHKAGFVDKLMGEKINSIIDNINKNLFICNLVKPLISSERIVLIVPPLSELEIGFEIWVRKVIKLSNELNIPVSFYGTKPSYDAIKTCLKQLNLRLNLSFNEHDQWEDLLLLENQIKNEDFIILINSRRGTISYINTLENMPSRLEKHFDENNLLVIYPQHFETNADSVEDITSGALTKGIEAIENIGKGIGNIFKKDY